MSATGIIEALQAAFADDQIAFPGMEQYEKLNGSYMAQQPRAISPAGIFQPKAKEDVAQFIRVIKPFVANDQAAFAIRGAGNMPTATSANIDGGITLDLSLLSAIEINEDTVSIGAGARWGAVDEAVQAVGLGVTGGRSGTGGIGGLALTGGLSFFSSREGFICDNVVNYEVVLASGDIVNANATENADLWVALKGGGNNFGVVTRFDMRTFKQGPFWGGNVYYFAPTFPSQIDALVAELQKPDSDSDTHIMINTGYAAQFGSSICLNTVYYTRETEDVPPVLEPFTEIQPQIELLNSLKATTLTEAASQQAAAVLSRVRCSYMNTTVKADAATLKAAADIYTAAIVPIQSVTGLICSLAFQPYSKSLLEASAANGGNSLGLDPSAGPAVSLLLLAYWQEQEDDDRIYLAHKEALEGIQAHAVQSGTALDYVNLNYSSGFQKPIHSYGTENLQKLQGVSKKYDPEGLFQKGVPGGFKLFH